MFLGFLSMGIVLLFFACHELVEVEDNAGFGGRDLDGDGIPDDFSPGGFQPTDVTWLDSGQRPYGGVDLLVVVDSSSSMDEEQEMLATEIFALVTALTKPVGGGRAVDEVRVAAVTTDLGLQYGGGEGVLSSAPDGPQGCAGRGDDGDLMVASGMVGPEIRGDRIACEPYGDQCPSGWKCDDGRCARPEGSSRIDCVFDPSSTWLETTSGRPNPDLASQSACLAEQGTAGCNVEQQLEAALRALYKNRTFLRDDHLLVVLTVTDEEDCSIESEELFSTEEWQSGADGLFSVSCNYPEDNEAFLFDPSRYYDDLINLKGGRVSSVIFSAVVGVPGGEGSPCVGDGDYLAENDCLAAPEMALEPERATNEDGVTYTHFKPACTRSDGDDDDLITVGRPGRRFVKVAELFGPMGHVHSICDESWAPMVEHIVSRVGDAVTGGVCPLSEPLRVTPDESGEPPCEDCVVSNCNLFLEVIRTGEQAADETCPDDLEFGSDADYYDKVVAWRDDDGTRILCPILRLPSEIDCSSARERYSDVGMAGWFYCQNDTSQENTEYTCSDGVDNDSDGIFDCEEEKCRRCAACGAEEPECAPGCSHEIALTELASEIAGESRLLLDCPIYE
jgi:hypothetical protein